MIKKYSISLKGHATSLSLEPIFWQELQNIAQEHAVPVALIVSQLDILSPMPRNLSSVIRNELYKYALHRENLIAKIIN